jgi:hypothetical protein
MPPRVLARNLDRHVEVEGEFRCHQWISAQDYVYLDIAVSDDDPIDSVESLGGTPPHRHHTHNYQAD